jgi:hypothetical protein
MNQSIIYPAAIGALTTLSGAIITAIYKVYYTPITFELGEYAIKKIEAPGRETAYKLFTKETGISRFKASIADTRRSPNTPGNYEFTFRYRTKTHQIPNDSIIAQRKILIEGILAGFLLLNVGSLYYVIRSYIDVDPEEIIEVISPSPTLTAIISPSVQLSNKASESASISVSNAISLQKSNSISRSVSRSYAAEQARLSGFQQEFIESARNLREAAEKAESISASVSAAFAKSTDAQTIQVSVSEIASITRSISTSPYIPTISPSASPVISQYVSNSKSSLTYALKILDNISSRVTYALEILADAIYRIGVLTANLAGKAPNFVSTLNFTSIPVNDKNSAIDFIQIAKQRALERIEDMQFANLELTERQEQEAFEQFAQKELARLQRLNKVITQNPTQTQQDLDKLHKAALLNSLISNLSLVQEQLNSLDSILLDTREELKNLTETQISISRSASSSQSVSASIHAQDLQESLRRARVNAENLAKFQSEFIDTARKLREAENLSNSVTNSLTPTLSPRLSAVDEAEEQAELILSILSQIPSAVAYTLTTIGRTVLVPELGRSLNQGLINSLNAAVDIATDQARSLYSSIIQLNQETTGLSFDQLIEPIQVQPAPSVTARPSVFATPTLSASTQKFLNNLQPLANAPFRPKRIEFTPQPQAFAFEPPVEAVIPEFQFDPVLLDFDNRFNVEKAPIVGGILNYVIDLFRTQPALNTQVAVQEVFSPQDEIQWDPRFLWIIYNSGIPEFDELYRLYGDSSYTRLKILELLEDSTLRPIVEVKNIVIDHYLKSASEYGIVIERLPELESSQIGTKIKNGQFIIYVKDYIYLLRHVTINQVPLLDLAGVAKSEFFELAANQQSFNFVQIANTITKKNLEDYFDLAKNANFISVPPSRKGSQLTSPILYPNAVDERRIRRISSFLGDIPETLARAGGYPLPEQIQASYPEDVRANAVVQVNNSLVYNVEYTWNSLKAYQSSVRSSFNRAVKDNSSFFQSVPSRAIVSTIIVTLVETFILFSTPLPAFTLGLISGGTVVGSSYLAQIPGISLIPEGVMASGLFTLIASTIKFILPGYFIPLHPLVIFSIALGANYATYFPIIPSFLSYLFEDISKIMGATTIDELRKITEENYLDYN